MYRIVRVNTPRMPHYYQALEDMGVIIEAGYYWKKSDEPYIPYGTPMIAMGGHGGRGLYLIGITSTDNKWEREDDAGSYRHRLPVIWQPVVYRHPAISTEAVANMVVGWNVRFGAQCSQAEFRRVLDFVLTGTAIDPYAEAAA